MPNIAVPYKYTTFSLPPSPAFPQGRVVHRPVVAVTLVNGQKKFSCYAILDTGADYCAFPLPFAFPLDLDPLVAVADQSMGVGSYGVPTYFWDLVIQLRGTQLVFPAKVGFTEGLNTWGLGLLGQDGFFNRYSVNFDLCRSTSFQIIVPQPSS